MIIKNAFEVAFIQAGIWFLFYVLITLNNILTMPNTFCHNDVTYFTDKSIFSNTKSPVYNVDGTLLECQEEQKDED